MNGDSYRDHVARDVLLAMVSSEHWARTMLAAAKVAGVEDAEPAPYYAAVAVAFADALIAELNREERGE